MGKHALCTLPDLFVNINLGVVFHSSHMYSMLPNAAGMLLPSFICVIGGTLTFVSKNYFVNPCDFPISLLLCLAMPVSYLK